MLTVGDMEYPSLVGSVPDDEWRTRVELAALYRLVVVMGWDDLSVTHISARVGDHYLFNPQDLLFEEVTASNLVKITLDGEIASNTPFKIAVGDWYPHKAVHAVREDANFVIHTHDDYGTAVSTQKRGLEAISQTAAFVLGGTISYHDYDGVETYEERIQGLQESLGSANFMILRNHGLLSLGRTAPEVFYRIAGLIKACRIQILAGPRTDHLVVLPDEMLATFPGELKRPRGNDAWPGLIRKLDRLDPSYKT